MLVSSIIFTFLFMFVPGSAIGSQSDSLDILQKESPMTYVITTGLLFAVTTMGFIVKVLWDHNNTLSAEKDLLHESKLKIAISTTETMKEAISLVKEIHSEVSKMSGDDINRRVLEESIKTSLSAMQNDIRLLSEEVRRAIQK